MHRYQAILAYDGTAYFGWQKTRIGPSIQGTLAEAIHAISSESPLPEAASRTDRGVHAEGQSVSIDVATPWEPKSLQKAINAHLPYDIRIRKLIEADPDFHPTLEAAGKEYRYRICLGPVQHPIHRLYSWAFRYAAQVRLNTMEIAAKQLLGTWDFSSLANDKKENPICTLQKIEFIPLPENRLEIVMSGDRFLYKMARNIVGTLLYVGCGKLPPDHIPKLLASKDRKKAGVTAPAHGLALIEVFYTPRA